MTKSHAQILADIAAKVVRQYRSCPYPGCMHYGKPVRHAHEAGTQPAGIFGPPIHDSWDYVLPEEYQG
jgi:hypothetical protein